MKHKPAKSRARDPHYQVSKMRAYSQAKLALIYSKKYLEADARTRDYMEKQLIDEYDI